MPNKPGPRKKPGERYPSGDLKRAIPPAIWGRIRDVLRDPRLSSELGRLWLHRELTETQAAAGFLITDIYCHSDSAERAKERATATTSAARGESHRAKSDRKTLDGLLSEYSPELREAVIELCVRGRTVDWKLRPDIGEVLDHVAEVWPDAVRQQAVSLSKLGSGGPLRRRHQPEVTAPRPDHDPDVEAIKKVIAVLKPDMDADAKASLIDHCLALRDREEFREEKGRRPKASKGGNRDGGT
jgi:hypothetical protein